MASATVRFSKVVERCGQPETYTLWVKPEQDKTFTSFLRQHRVMTVHQETTGSKADYGLVGFNEDRHRSLLIFPKSLKNFEDKRVVGIKYDELKEASAGEEEVTPEPKKKPRPEKAKPKPKKKAEPPPPPPPNQIPFPKPEIVRDEKPSDASDDSAELRKVMQQALEALEKDKPVAAYKLLQQALKEK